MRRLHWVTVLLVFVALAGAGTRAMVAQSPASATGPKERAEFQVHQEKALSKPMELEQVLSYPGVVHQSCNEQPMFAQKLLLEDAFAYFADMIIAPNGPRNKVQVWVVVSYCTNQVYHPLYGEIANRAYVTLHDAETGALLTEGTRSIEMLTDRISKWRNRETPPALENHPSLKP